MARLWIITDGIEKGYEAVAVRVLCHLEARRCCGLDATMVSGVAGAKVRRRGPVVGSREGRLGEVSGEEGR